MRSSTSSLALAIAVAALASFSANGAGCTAQPGGLTGGLTGSGGGSAANGATTGVGGGLTQDPKALFTALQPDLVAACGDCHKAGGLADTPFLAEPDVYASITSWPGIVMKDPTQSVLLTYPRAGGKHSGTSLDDPKYSGTLLPKLTEWLTAEAAVIGKPIDASKPTIPPAAPIMGFNAIYLSKLDPKLDGVAITFNATTLAPTTLQLSDVQVHTTTKTGVHLVHPLFVVYPKGKDADPDPVDNFAGIDTSVDTQSSVPLGQGLVILDNWVADAKLSIVFETAEPYSTGGTGGAGGATGGGGGCKDLTDFNAAAAPQFQSRCFGCHGGGNGAATAAVDMSALSSNPAAACAQIKNRINPASPASSQLFVTTDPGGNAAHPFKFGGSATQFGAFKTALNPWIVGEN